MESVNRKIDEFFQPYKHQAYKKGEILIRAEDEPRGIFYPTKETITKSPLEFNFQALPRVFGS